MLTTTTPTFAEKVNTVTTPVPRTLTTELTPQQSSRTALTVNTCHMSVPPRFLTVSSVSQVMSARMLVPRPQLTAHRATTVLKELALPQPSAPRVTTAQLTPRTNSSATTVPSLLALVPLNAQL